MFNFLKIIKPSWYFNLPGNINTPVFIHPHKLPEHIYSLLSEDKRYKSKDAFFADLSYQAFHKGYISTKTEDCFDIWKSNIPVEDEYRFIRRFYASFWSYYICMIRIFTFNNPLKEIYTCFKTRNIKQINLYDDVINYTSFHNYKSSLVHDRPLISVIIPTLNRYKYLEDILKDFTRQTYSNFEIIVIDQSRPFRQKFYQDWSLNIKVIQQKEKALWLARNQGIKEAKGDYIALSEDDVRIEPDWLENHLKALDFFKVQISNGVFYPQNSVIPKSHVNFRISDQFATGNAVIEKNVFKKTGLFDRQFEKQRMGDGEYGLRAYLNGYVGISNPYASCIDIKAPTGGLRQTGSWDAFRPKSFFSPRPVPSVLYYFRKYYGNKQAILSLIISIPPSIIPYRFKRKKSLLLFGSLISLLFFPFLMIQITRSWKLSSQKLKQGAKIDDL